MMITKIQKFILIQKKELNLNKENHKYFITTKMHSFKNELKVY